MSAREEVLRRVARARSGTAAPVRREYRGAGAGEVPAEYPDAVALFAARVAEYRARVVRCEQARAASVVGELLSEAGHRDVLAAPGVPAPYLDAAGARTALGTDLTGLTAVDAVVTTCACAIALTGTIVLDHGEGQGRRALTLVPDCHLVVVRSDQIVVGVPDAIARLDPTRPLTWISGPSATSDIELERVEGVHGPRELIVVVVE